MDISGDLAVRLLGPLEVTRDGQSLTLTSGRQQALLAVLAISAGRTVSVETIADVLWHTDMPRNLRGSVQTHIARLRGLLGGAAIRTTSSGYALTADAQVDALRFIGLLDVAQHTDPKMQHSLLVEATDLWRGMPFEGIPSRWLAETESPRLLEKYLAAVERRIDIDLAAGRHGDLIAELIQLTARFRLRESLWVRLLDALARSGRQAEALERYDLIRSLLAEELGTDPGPQLRQGHADLLAGHVTTAAPPPEDLPVPRQLPPGPAELAGRREHLARLDRLLSLAAPTRVVVLHGTAGTGKTALAMLWAHRVADRFSDGQLFLNLRGYEPDGSTPASRDVVRGFLEALRIPQDRIPTSADAQVNLYRSLLAGKRMLIVLDNARHADQVYPLLPGSRESLVIVTSRNPLLGLTAATGAYPLAVDLLSVTEAKQLLELRLGPARICAEPEAVSAIIMRCARLPLALTIVAARAATHPGFPLSQLANELAGDGDRLDALATGDPTTDVRAVLSWSYHALSRGAARLFRLFGVHPGPHMSTAAAASLLGVELGAVRPLLSDLTRDNLAVEEVQGRYAFHDLLREYASELAQLHDTNEDRSDAHHRLLDHYLHTAYQAGLLWGRPENEVHLPPTPRDVTLERFDDAAAATTWFVGEYPVLLAVLRLGSQGSFAQHAFHLATAMWTFLERQGRWHDLIATEHLALLAAQSLPARSHERTVHRALGRIHAELDQFDEASRFFDAALTMAVVPEDEAVASRDLAWLAGRRGDYRAALAECHKALAISRDQHDAVGEAQSLNAIGWYHSKLGEAGQGLRHCHEALSLFTEVFNQHGQASTLDSIGYAYQLLGNNRDAILSYAESVKLRRETGHKYGEAETLQRLAEVYLDAGEPESARAAWDQASQILQRLGHPDAEV